MDFDGKFRSRHSGFRIQKDDCGRQWTLSPPLWNRRDKALEPEDSGRIRAAWNELSASSVLSNVLASTEGGMLSIIHHYQERHGRQPTRPPRPQSRLVARQPVQAGKLAHRRKNAALTSGII